MTDELSDLIEEVVDASKSEQDRVITKIVATQIPEEVALLLESLPLEQRLEAWSSVPANER